MYSNTQILKPILATLSPASNATRFSVLALGFLLLTTSACGGGGGGDSEEPSSSSSSSSASTSTSSSGGSGSSGMFSLGASADATGVAAAQFTLPAFTNKFSVTAEVAGSTIRFVSLESDRGVNYVSPDGQTISLGEDPSPSVKAVNAPSRDFDPEVLDFANYTARVATEGNKSVVFTVNTKDDPNLSTGNLKVNVFLVGNAAQRSGAAQSIDTALARMSDILRLSGGVVAQITRINIDGPDVLPDPGNGSDFYLNATAAAASPAVNLFIGAEVGVGGSPGDTLLGIAADIPGPPNPSPRSAVAISLIGSAGPDGRFGDDEIRLLGETFAHELCHFMGLFHPVEISGVAVVDVDPLPDTDECTTTVNCLNNADLFANLMFPFPVPENEDLGTTVPQDRLSTQQRGVINRYIAVD